MQVKADISDFGTRGFAGPFELENKSIIADVNALVKTGLEFKEARGGLQDRHFISPYSGRPLLSANNHLAHNKIQHLGQDPAIVAALTQLMGKEVWLRRSQCWRKPPNCRPVMWHQDTHKYRGLGFIDQFSAWIALEDATIENGCIWFLDGSNAGGIVQREDFLNQRFQARFYNTDSLEIPENLNRFPAVPMELKAGQFVLFHQLCFHASGPNKTDGERIGIAFRYLPGATTGGIDDTLVQIS